MKKKESRKEKSGQTDFKKQVETAVRSVLRNLEKDEYSVTIAGDTMTIRTEGNPELTIFMLDNKPSSEEVMRIRKDNMAITEEEDENNVMIITQSMWTSVQKEIVRQIRQLVLPEELDSIYIDNYDRNATFRTECITRDEYEKFISGKSQKPAEIPERHRMTYLVAKKNDGGAIAAAVALCVSEEGFKATDILASGYVTNKQYMRTQETLDDMLSSLFSSDCDNMDDCVMEVFGGMYSHELTVTLVQDARLYGAFTDAETYDESECEEDDEEEFSDAKNEDRTYVHEYSSPWYIDDRITETSSYPAMALMCPYHYNQYAEDLDIPEFSPGYIKGYAFDPSQHRAMINMLTIKKEGLETVTGGWKEEIRKFIEEGMKKDYVSYNISADELSGGRTAIATRGNIGSETCIAGVVILGKFSADDAKKYNGYPKMIWVTEKILNAGKKETMRCISQICGFDMKTTPLTLVRKWKTKLITKAEYEKFSEDRNPFHQDEKKQFIDNTDMGCEVLYAAVCDETGEFVCAATLTIEDDVMVVIGLVVRDGMARGTVFVEKMAYEVIQQKVKYCSDEYRIMFPMSINLYTSDGYSKIWNQMVINGMPVQITGDFWVIATDYGSLKKGMYGGLGSDSYDDVRDDVIKYIESIVREFNSKSAEESITTETDVSVIPYSKYSADVRLVKKEPDFGVLDTLDILFAYDTPDEYFLMNKQSLDEDYEMDDVMTISREIWTQARKTVKRTLVNRIGIDLSDVLYDVLSDYKFETISCDMFDNMADGYLEEELNEYNNLKYYKVSDKSDNTYCIMEVGYNEGSTLIAHNIAFMSEKYDDNMYTVMTVLSDIYDSLIKTEKRKYRHIKKIAVEYDAGIYGSDTAFLYGGFNKSLKNHKEGRRTLRYSIDIKKFKKLLKDKKAIAEL